MGLEGGEELARRHGHCVMQHWVPRPPELREDTPRGAEHVIDMKENQLENLCQCRLPVSLGVQIQQLDVSQAPLRQAPDLGLLGTTGQLILVGPISQQTSQNCMGLS